MPKYFWKNKKVLVTGHTGFKGAWLSFWLKHKKAKVYGISLKEKKPLQTISSVNPLFSTSQL